MNARGIPGFLGGALLDLLLPPRCHICRTQCSGADPLHICDDCTAQLPFITEPFCSVCGVPFSATGDSHPCGRCLTDPPPFQAARAVFTHTGSCRDLLHAFKYAGQAHLRRPLGLLAARTLVSFAGHCRADLLLPVPLHRARLRSRGFNQALLLAELLSRHWQIPLQRQALLRTRPTVPQMELDRNARLHNLNDAFAVASPALVADRRIILVDDVTTTGSTLRECALVLKRAGAAAVFAVTISHAP
ncbi:ComF family protein [Trichlorobacter ammonificans]|uniref:ComF family protein n=1 Tax=Trichlorobacter ammonificans TaxID=2916410 RepID=A0ABM9D6W1_9BACT|nr:ComF family protein [Trichlorobacter ammonificans]CAH2030463.1 ComF family protein [Trichlorobacter ammonificans]